MSQPPNLTIPGANFRYLRWVAMAVVIVVLLLAVFTSTATSIETIKREGGILETLSYMFWFTAVLCSAGTIYRWRERDDQLMAFCLGTLALLAALRELDLHHRVRPEHLGAYGVHFRIAWWLDRDVNLVLKAGWLIIFALLIAALCYPVWKVRPPALAMAWRGNSMVGLFILAVFLCGLGGFIDDQLRGTTFVSKELRQLVEETTELLGAMAYAASAWLRWRYPLAAHLQSVELPVRVSKVNLALP